MSKFSLSMCGYCKICRCVRRSSGKGSSNTDCETFMVNTAKQNISRWTVARDMGQEFSSDSNAEWVPACENIATGNSFFVGYVGNLWFAIRERMKFLGTHEHSRTLTVICAHADFLPAVYCCLFTKMYIFGPRLLSGKDCK